MPILRRLPKLKTATSCKTSAVALTWWLMPWAAISAFDPQFRYAHLLATPSLVLLFAIVVETILRDLFDGECDRRHGIRSFANLYPGAARMALFAGVLVSIPFLLEIWPLWRAGVAITCLSLFAVLAALHRRVALRTLHRIGDLTLISLLLVL